MDRRWIVCLGLLVLAFTAGCVEFEFGQPGSAGDTLDDAAVTAVVDGDTIDVRLANGTDERVRLLGVDTPEVHVDPEPEHYEGVPDTPAARSCLTSVGENASRYVRNRLSDQSVDLEVDPASDGRGGYGRLLAIVHHNGSSLNFDLVSRGYAGVYPTSFGERERYESAAATAREDGRGLWRCQNA